MDLVKIWGLATVSLPGVLDITVKITLLASSQTLTLYMDIDQTALSLSVTSFCHAARGELARSRKPPSSHENNCHWMRKH